MVFKLAAEGEFAGVCRLWLKHAAKHHTVGSLDRFQERLQDDVSVFHGKHLVGVQAAL